MFCTGCGNNLPDGAVKCPKCNKVVKSLSPPAGVAPRKPAPAQPAKPQTPPKKTAAPQPAAPAPKGKHAKKKAGPPVEGSAPSGPPPEPVFSPIEHDTGISYGRAFVYFFKDKDWLKKWFVISVTFPILILNFYSVGYVVQLARKVSNGIDLPLPEVDFPNIWQSGLMYGLSFMAMTAMGMVISLILVLFSQLPMISVLAVPLLAIFAMVFTVYLVGSSIIAIIEGNPWLNFNFPVCVQIIMENLTDTILTSILILFVFAPLVLYIASFYLIIFNFSTLALLICVSCFVVTLLTDGFACLISCSLIGQLGRIYRTTSKFL